MRQTLCDRCGTIAEGHWNVTFEGVKIKRTRYGLDDRKDFDLCQLCYTRTIDFIKKGQK